MKQENKFKFIWFWQPLLIAFFPITSILGKNGDRITLLHAFFAISIPSICVALVFFFLSFTYQSYRKGALATNILIVLFYGTKFLMDALFAPLSVLFYYFRVRYILILILLATIYFLYKLSRIKHSSSFFLQIACIPFLFLNLFALTSFMYQKITFEKRSKILVQQKKLFRKQLDQFLKQIKRTNTNFPNIYFIILDTYPSNDVLAKEFNFDNQEFTLNLNAKGFQLPSRSLSNYAFTCPSLYTTLHMNFLPGKKIDVPYGSMLSDNNVRYFLEKLGYSYIDLSTEYDDIALLKEENYFKLRKERQTIWAEFKIFLFGLHYFTSIFMSAKTPIYPLYERIAEWVRRNAILKKLKILTDTTFYKEKPLFVYTHLMIPHAPPSFDEHGNPYPRLTKNETPAEWQKRGFIQAVKFINKKMIGAIDHILANSPQPPIIILQADHGAGFAGSTVKDWYKILNAFYLPNYPKAVPDNIAPINNFRFIFNHYFGTNFPLLENKMFLGPLSGKTIRGKNPQNYTRESIENQSYIEISQDML